MTRLFDSVIEDLRKTLLRMGGLAESILEKAVQSVWERKADLAAQVRQDDLDIDRLDVQIDERVLRALALQAPVAEDLRQVIAIKMMATDLERVGDIARNIAKSALRLAERPAVVLPPKLEEMADEARRMLKDSLDSFADGDPSKARAVLAADDRIDEDQDRVVRDAILEISAHPEFTSQEVDLIMIAKNLERVGDHATNI
ncbi:MAG TPA: phosphate transport system regulatory protein PhoU, partial [Deltaproteobacteria bacterium]|nr:phosphate transport system regulatory protein PhoU [Deltaproteobacteria bacterium]